MDKIKFIFISILLLNFVSCSTLERIKRVGEEPKFNKMEIPVSEDSPVSYADEEQNISSSPNSLWSKHRTSHFRNKNHWRVGDILITTVSIQDSATLNNSSQQQRANKEHLDVPNLFGQEDNLAKVISPKGDKLNLVNENNTRDYKGQGNINRKESINAQIATQVTQILPNGNLVIKGRQEIRINYELREIAISGIVKPGDIGPNNEIKSSKIAEARISYGGRGFVSDVQQPRLGSQVVDIVSPF